MRASTVFAVALALLVALAAAAGAKYAGLFDKKEVAPAAAEKHTPVKVLVAKANLFEDVTVISTQVGVRELTAEEEKALSERLGGGTRWKEKLMPALPSAAHFRVPNRNIPADQVLLKDYFSDQLLPEEISARLEPRTRAVNVALPKDKVAGGVIRVGEYVDVMLSTTVTIGDREELRTACLARGCKIIMKRNNIWAVMASDPDDKPVHFTLQANAYRAALIEYGQTHGSLSLQPAPPPVKQPNGSFSDPTSLEYATEDQRVQKMLDGAMVIGDEDLARVFKVVQPAPPPVDPDAPAPTIIYHLSGVSDAGKTVIPHPITKPGASPATTSPPNAPKTSDSPVVPAGGAPRAAVPAPSAPAPVSFKLPSATGGKCTACEEAKKKAAAEARKAAAMAQR